MKLNRLEKVWFLCFVIWIILWLGPGLLLFNYDAYVGSFHVLWLWAIIGWWVALILIYIGGYKLSITNLEYYSDEEDERRSKA